MTAKRTVVLGITGSIAAYKGADLCSRMTAAGLDVTVIMTDAAGELIRPRTFMTLSRNPVVTSLWDEPDWRPGHIDLADRAAVLLIAPCTANCIGKLAHGIADDALSTFAISHQGPVIIAPAMNPKMWQSAAVRDNIAILKERGVIVVGPAAGRVACGDAGIGRMEEPDVILSTLEQVMKKTS